ncbi:RrF2 family transcriptional regulator [Hafnia psychrotolerans]|jgi:Rrf2 family transcriptional repressor of oqxAB|uniref:Transcriptional regulator n=1 Tax=Hafnia psychrotolerans TaxID=1477018 RepID=A0ABQ1H1E8_9GAMM|nr:Rrf2 family transcriptional regulator [Hafnia psychrotolerans]GGA55445.1 transcriptional regulator [Hafnia psychrotolerans]
MLDFRFPTAMQMVLSVAVAEKVGIRSTSAVLAASLEANPSFIRKLMVPLTRNGIIISTLGRNGSIHLGRPANEITLRDIYTAVIDDKRIWAARPEVAARCLVSANACWYFKSVVNEAEEASLDVLARHTVADALAQFECNDKRVCTEERQDTLADK